MTTKTIIIICAALLIGCFVPSTRSDPIVLQQQVADTERAFAQSMADRDFSAFKSFLSDEAVFFSGATAVRGKQRIADAWKPYFEQVEAPFSWEPESVVVLDSGTLALSTGPVLGSDGKSAGTFTSIWRLDSSGNWHIIFDKGNQACNCPSP